MKSVGKQLQEARLARNWTPELAARETKIKVDRLLDLEKDDYSHFSSPAYARGFVRTYARFLALDEYKILRQLDNKLPDDDHANLVSESGASYLPESSMPPRAAHRNYAGLYIVMALGCLISLIIAFVLIEAYRVGELQRYFATVEASSGDNTAGTNSVVSAETNAVARALPVDSSAPPPVPTPAEAAKALPVNPADLAASTNASPANNSYPAAVRALPVDPSELTNSTSETVALGTPPVAPRALPVDPALLPPAATNGAPLAMTVTPTPPSAPIPVPAVSARQSNSGPVVMPAHPPVPTPVAAPVALPVVTPDASPTPQAAAPPSPAATTEKRLVLTASQDSFVRVTSLDASDSDKALYASVLHSGQSVAFDGHKFSINVGVPSAVDIQLDGVNYGPHSDQSAPETFTVESHQP
ncbi:MAG: DUF4115 domain-containing protein [Methylacidiphilales bacterium]|nr:DUF4115 domain-containing protein [Candidatus Methylacidiphilales bacterium]